MIIVLISKYNVGLLLVLRLFSFSVLNLATRMTLESREEGVELSPIV